MYLHSVPEMKAVISADIILEPRNTVIYYSPLIKASISLSVPLLSSLPLKASPPPSPSFTHLSLHTLSHPLINFLHDPSYMPLLFLFLPFFAPLLSPSPLLLPPISLYFLSIFFLSRFRLFGLINERPGIGADLQRSALWEGLG